MAMNSGQIDLNTDAVLLDRENEVLGFNPLGSHVSVGVSHGQTLTTESVGVGVRVVSVYDHKVRYVGGDNSGLLEPVVVGGSGMNPGCDVMVNGSGKESFCKGAELVDRGIDLEVGLGLVGGGCHGERGGLSGGVVGNDDVKNEMECSEGAPHDGGCHGERGELSAGLVVGNDDVKNELECSEGAPHVCAGAGTDEGLAFELIVSVKNELECENGGRVSGYSLVRDKVASANGARGVDNVRVAGEDGPKMEAADNLVNKEGLEERHASEVTTCQLQNGFPDMEVADVDAKELLHQKDSIFRSPHMLTTSYEVKQPAFHVDAQVEATQNQTIDITHAKAGHFENIQNECHGFNLVVDLNSSRNMPGVDLYRGSVFSDQNFCVSDLVWGKVMGHPWWPGQIVDSSAASEKAKRHLKKDGYLIAYFGDRTFAWNDSSMIKPFQMHFSQMVKQNNLESFHHAVDCSLDEVSRRVEFGLSCPCIPKEVFSRLITQVISNAGICRQSRRRHGGDRHINASSFEPLKLVNFIKSLAQSPLNEFDRLDFVIARAQLSAFNRSKGYSQLPEFSVLGGLLNDMQILLMKEKEQCNDLTDGKGLTTNLGFSQKRKHSSRDCKRPSRRHKLLSDLMSEDSYFIPDAEHALETKAGDQSVPRRRGRKRKAVYNSSDDIIHNSQASKSAQLQHVSVDEMWSQLCLAATDPVGQGCTSDTVYFFAGFRNFVSRNSSTYLEQEMSLRHMHAEDAGVTSIEPVTPPMTSTMEPCNDSYWTDRIIQCISEEQPSSKYQNGREEYFPETQTGSGYPFSESQPAAEVGADRNQGSEPSSSKLMEHLDESCAEDTTPTALSLKFTSLDSVPSATDLNKIFGRYGPLIESRTELIEKSNRARVVFKRRSDAETAFSSAGKYSIFGPSLVSYRLKILPRTQKKGTGKRGRKSRKETSSVQGAAV